MESEKSKAGQSRGDKQGARTRSGKRAWFRRANDFPGTCVCGRDVRAGDGLWAGKVYCKGCADEVRTLGS